MSNFERKCYNGWKSNPNKTITNDMHLSLYFILQTIRLYLLQNFIPFAETSCRFSVTANWIHLCMNCSSHDIFTFIVLHKIPQQSGSCWLQQAWIWNKGCFNIKVNGRRFWIFLWSWLGSRWHWPCWHNGWRLMIIIISVLILMRSIQWFIAVVAIGGLVHKWLSLKSSR